MQTKRPTDKRIRLNEHELKVIYDAIIFYQKNGGTPEEIAKRIERPWMVKDVLCLDNRFYSLVNGQTPDRGRKWRAKAPPT